MDLVKAQEMGLKLVQTFSVALVHKGDIPAECIARVVGHDQTILFESPSELSNDPAIQADVRASGGRLLDPDQHRKRLRLNMNCANSISPAFHEDEPEKELLQYQIQGTEVDERTAELHSKQGNTDVT